ncbi:heavy-metal-associated domain-containing protein [Undibacterium terreum]|uniref:HMA domain-containing protein n=1 Tax=Undibacterium terreum TaxID=1224302 RepID=A0A916UIT5_9BURK|nr:cation transporter [Undibacterium terreum]GGC74686.1 hypothetical protein GCM10011396_22420 [Undibacterium terreum]
MVVLQVEEMSCAHCVSMVTKAVQSVDSAARVDIDLASKKVQVDSQADVTAIADAINDAGYPVTSSTTM